MKIRELWGQAEEERVEALRWALEVQDAAGYLLLIEDASSDLEQEVRSTLEEWAEQVEGVMQTGLSPAHALSHVLWRQHRLRASSSRHQGLLSLLNNQMASGNVMRLIWFCVARLVGMEAWFQGTAGASLIVRLGDSLERVNPTTGERLAMREDDLDDEAEAEDAPPLESSLLLGVLGERRRAAQTGGDPERAYQLARISVTLFPESAEGWASLSELAWEVGDYARANDAIETMRERFAGSALTAVASRRFKQRRPKSDLIH